MQTGFEPFGACWPSTLGTDKLAEEGQGSVCDGWEHSWQPERPIASVPSYIEDLRTMAHTVEPKRQALNFSSHLNLHRCSWGGPEEVVYLNRKACSL